VEVPKIEVVEPVKLLPPIMLPLAEPAKLPALAPATPALVELDLPKMDVHVRPAGGMPDLPPMPPPTVSESPQPVAAPPLPKVDVPKPLESPSAPPLPKADAVKAIELPSAAPMPKVDAPKPLELPSAPALPKADAPKPLELPAASPLPKVEPPKPLELPSAPPLPKVDAIKPLELPAALPLPKVEPPKPLELPSAPPLPKVDAIKPLELPAASLLSKAEPPKPLELPKAELMPRPDGFVSTGQARTTALPKAEEPIRTTAALAPREDYDVDVHYAVSGDSWGGISKAHLGDERYAEALRAYNSNRPLAANQPVDVPPLHVLRKQFANLVSAPRRSEPQDAPRTGGGRTYEVPSGGLTLKQLARDAFGDENLWGQIWEMNPKLRADEPIAGGTRIKLPSDAKIGE